MLTDLFAVKMYKNNKKMTKKIDIIYKFFSYFSGILWYTNMVYQKMWEETQK